MDKYIPRNFTGDMSQLDRYHRNGMPGNMGRGCGCNRPAEPVRENCGCNQPIEPVRESCGCQPVVPVREGCGCASPAPVNEACDGNELFPIGMSYVPWQQWKSVYDIEMAFKRGTLFPELDLPFCCGCNREGCMDQNLSNRARALRRVQMAGFAIDDIKLYLDTHGTDAMAMECYEKYKVLYQEAVAAFTCKYGPLTADTVPGNCWSWTDRPMPWEREC